MNIIAFKTNSKTSYEECLRDSRESYRKEIIEIIEEQINKTIKIFTKLPQDAKLRSFYFGKLKALEQIKEKIK